MSGFPVDSIALFDQVNSRFSEAERVELDAMDLNRFPEERSRLLNVIASWGWKVRVFAGQLDRSLTEPDPKIWGADDLAGALFNRDRVETMLAQVPEVLSGRVRAAVDEFDVEYRAFTVDDNRDEITRVAHVGRDREGWWWHRIPDRGPVREELNTLLLDSKVLCSELRSRFTEDELTVLDAIAEGDPARDQARLLNSMSSWASGVRTVAWQLSDSRPLPYLKIRGVRDLIGMFTTRDRVESLVVEVPETLAGKVRDVLAEFDEQYRAITVDDHDDRIVRLARVGRDRQGWWWHRIPGDGPVCVELDLLTARDGSGSGSTS
jgi:hypothetical protein